MVFGPQCVNTMLKLSQFALFRIYIKSWISTGDSSSIMFLFTNLSIISLFLYEPTMTQSSLSFASFMILSISFVLYSRVTLPKICSSSFVKPSEFMAF